MSDMIIPLFLLGACTDVGYVLWLGAVKRRSYVISVLMSMCLGGISLFSFVSVDTNRLLAIPYLLGLGFGTFLGLYATRNEKPPVQ